MPYLVGLNRKTSQLRRSVEEEAKAVNQCNQDDAAAAATTTHQIIVVQGVVGGVNHF